MGCFAFQPPSANWKKLTHAIAERSRSAGLRPCVSVCGDVAPATAPLAAKPGAGQYFPVCAFRENGRSRKIAATATLRRMRIKHPTPEFELSFSDLRAKAYSGVTTKSNGPLS